MKMKHFLNYLTLFLVLITPFQAIASKSGDDKFIIGKPGSSANKYIQLGSTSQGFIRFNTSTGKLQYSHDGATYKTVGLGSDLDSASALNGDLLTANGSGGSSFVTPATKFAPTTQTFIATGTKTGSYFVVSAANATAGATYVNNTQTFTVVYTISGGTGLVTSGTGTPLSSGTLTKASGTGDATITFSSTQALATYTPPSSPSPLYLKITTSGGGGGGDNGTNGGITTFGTITSFGGSSSGSNGTGASGEAAGGSCSVGTTTKILQIPGGNGSGGCKAASTFVCGGIGGQNPLAGAGTSSAGTGGNAISNTGAGGGGGTSGSGWYGCGGGGAGGYTVSLAPNGSYYYSIGLGGSAGAGSQCAAGGNGAAGIVIVEEHYQ